MFESVQLDDRSTLVESVHLDDRVIPAGTVSLSRFLTTTECPPTPVESAEPSVICQDEELLELEVAEASAPADFPLELSSVVKVIPPLLALLLKRLIGSIQCPLLAFRI